MIMADASTTHYRPLSPSYSLFCAALERLAKYHDKILDLFHHRRIEWLFTRSAMAGDSGFYRQLMDLQARIYDLDDYLESTWNLMPSKLTEFWAEIEHAPAFKNLPETDIKRLLADIRQYQSQEMLVRTGGDITLVAISDFYHFKTCDVRLMRDLIYLQDPHLQREFPEEFWMYFDLITEVEDDLNDQAEDQHTHNVNRYLAAKHTYLPEALQTEYQDYVEQTYAQSMAKIDTVSFPWNDTFKDWLDEARARVIPMIT